MVSRRFSRSDSNCSALLGLLPGSLNLRDTLRLDISGRTSSTPALLALWTPIPCAQEDASSALARLTLLGGCSDGVLDMLRYLNSAMYAMALRRCVRTLRIDSTIVLASAGASFMSPAIVPKRAISQRDVCGKS
jgi:hypothetical protein